MTHPSKQCSLHLVAALVCAGLASACGGDNQPPVLAPLVDQQAFVNVELAVALSAADAEGDPLAFRFESDVPNVDARATMQDVGPGRAVFRWTPVTSDLGIHTFEFVASDGASESRATVAIEVSRSGEGSGAPVFVQPLGTGTTFDTRVAPCLELPVVVQDPDSPGVELGQEEPLIFGATLAQDGELSGTFGFCPTEEQLARDDRYTLVLSADDFDNPKTLKEYLLVIRQENKPDCPGDAPVVEHAPMNVSTVNDVTLRARVTDDVGIKYEPLLYYSLTPPSDPPDVTQMTQLTMGLEDGDMTDGTWTVAVPNPVAAAGAGATAQLHYVIVAQDNDDMDGTCDHLTQVPEAGAFKITVENPGGGGGLGLCETCTADVQCGDDPSDHCVFLDNAFRCFSGCAHSSECPSGYYCSFSTFTSIDGAPGRQCIPDGLQCQPSGGTCVDDSFEENDSLAAAKTIAPGTHPNLMSCPAPTSGDDEDWYKFVLTGDRLVTVSITGGSATDLDLALKSGAGAVIDKSDSLSSSEQVSACLPAGTYYVHVYAYGTGANPYSLTFSAAAQSCGASCQDDENEDDDNAAQARFVNLNDSPYVSTTQAICSLDDDWYDVFLYAGETLHASLLFSQASGAEDLDLYLYNSALVNLTGCSESTPSACDPFNGQSGTADEKMEWPITTTGTYYVVVHGWAGAENLYDICIGLSDADCPDP